MLGIPELAGLLLVIEDFVQTVWGKSNLSVPTPPALAFSVEFLGAALAGLAGVVAAPFLSLSPHMSSDAPLLSRGGNR